MDAQEPKATPGLPLAPEDLFEGRADDLARITDLLASAATGPGAALLVRGEAGIGKTVLLERALADLGSRWPVLRVRADELGQGIPFAALANGLVPLRSCRDNEVERLATDLAEALFSPDDDAAARRHGAAVRLFAELQDRAPTVLAIDDVDHLDDDSVALIATLLRRADRHPLILLATLRHPGVEVGDALGLLLERLDRDGTLHLIDLLPLASNGLESLVTALLGVPPAAELLTLLERKSGGNPFFAVQALHELAERDALDLSGDACGVRGSSHELSEDRRIAVLNRILRVGPTARRFAQAASLLGEVPLERIDLVADLAELPHRDAEDAFDALVERGILRVEGQRARFCHGLVRDAAYQSLRPGERWRMHKQAAAQLEAYDSPALAREVARHTSHVAEYGDEHAIEILTQEADRACRTAPRTSIRWYERALAVTPPEWPEHAQLQSRLARALFLAARPQAAAEVGRAALERIPPSTTRDRLALLVIEALNESSSIDEAVVLVDQERSAGNGGLRLTAQAAYILVVAGRLDDAAAAADEVFERLDEATPADQIHALSHLSHYCWLAGRNDDLAQIWDAMTAVADLAPPTAQLNGYASMSYVFASQGDGATASEALARAQALLSTSGLGLYRAELATAQARNAFHLGDWDTVIEIADSMAGELEAGGSMAYLSTLQELKVTVLANQGHWVAARRLMDHDAPDQPTFGSAFATTLAELDRTSGELDVAISRLQQHLLVHRMPIGLRMKILALLADIQADAGHHEAVRDTLAELARIGRGDGDPTSHTLMLLARGRADHDLDALHEAMELSDRHRLALLQGKARLFLGALDVDTEEHLREAIRIFHGLGATPWRRKAAAELRNRGLQVPRHRAPRSTFLTETEAQIARLVQRGRPNREIALTVCLSVKTVEAYLTRIFAKTGTTNRLELALTLEKGLLD